MVALSGLNTASTLLQQIASRQGTASRSQTSVPTLARAASGASTASGSAAKSVGSAIFNAVADATEKQDASVKAVLDYIDREYTHVEDTLANTLKTNPDDAALREVIAKHKAVGEALKQEVLADPAEISKMLGQVRTSRPEVSPDDAIGVMIVDLGNQKSRETAAS